MAYEKPLILVVEDERSTAELMRELLLDQFEVVACSDGLDALAIVKGRQPALIVLDLGLPLVTGEQFARAYRADGGRAPILVVSGRPDAWTIADDIGADEVLPKPFELGMLERTIETLLRTDVRGASG
jgi:DNA-binding response OmpR family regulator